jgi:hypothetical protein
MAAYFKMATKTKFAYVAKKTIVCLRDFWPIRLCFFIDFGLKKIKKIFGSSKIKNGRLIQDNRQNLIYFLILQTVYFINFFLLLNRLSK